MRVSLFGILLCLLLALFPENGFATRLFTIVTSGTFAGSKPAQFGNCIIEPGDKAHLIVKVDQDRAPYMVLEGSKYYASITWYRFVVTRENEIILEYEAETKGIDAPKAPDGHFIKQDKEAGAPRDALYIVMAGQSASICDTSSLTPKAFEFVSKNETGGDLVSSLEIDDSKIGTGQASTSFIQLKGDSLLKFTSDVVASTLYPKNSKEMFDLIFWQKD